MQVTSWFTNSAQRQSSPGAVRRQCGSLCIATRRGHQPGYTGQPPAPIKDSSALRLLRPELGSDCARPPAAARLLPSGNTGATPKRSTPPLAHSALRATVPSLTQGSPWTRFAIRGARVVAGHAQNALEDSRRVTAGQSWSARTSPLATSCIGIRSGAAVQPQGPRLAKARRPPIACRRGSSSG
jgi:hypothetical protein